MTRRVRFTKDAEADLDRLFTFPAAHDLDAAVQALSAIEEALPLLARFPFSCRKPAGGRHGPFLREAVVPFGTAGYVLLFEIERRHVAVLAVRHQRESDYR